MNDQEVVRSVSLECTVSEEVELVIRILRSLLPRHFSSSVSMICVSTNHHDGIPINNMAVKLTFNSKGNVREASKKVLGRFHPLH